MHTHIIHNLQNTLSLKQKQAESTAVHWSDPVEGILNQGQQFQYELSVTYSLLY